MRVPQLFDLKSDGPRFEAPDARGRRDAPKRSPTKSPMTAERIDRRRLNAKLPQDGAHTVQRNAGHGFVLVRQMYPEAGWRTMSELVEGRLYQFPPELERTIQDVHA
jgi:hypothetical protein